MRSRTLGATHKANQEMMPGFILAARGVYHPPYEAALYDVSRKSVHRFPPKNGSVPVLPTQAPWQRSPQSMLAMSSATLTVSLPSLCLWLYGQRDQHRINCFCPFANFLKVLQQREMTSILLLCYFCYCVSRFTYSADRSYNFHCKTHGILLNIALNFAQFLSFYFSCI